MGEGINYIVSWSMAIIMFIGMAYIFKGVGKIKQAEDSNENNSQIKKSQYKYYAKSYVMTSRENDCFKILNEIFSSKWFVVPQVHLSALLDYRVKGQNWNAAFRHINGKSVDFVLIGKESYKVICVIELDDSTHSKPDRIERDVEIERMFKEAGIPLARISKFESMTKPEIAKVVTDAINGNSIRS
jgi:hypothetical protein